MTWLWASEICFVLFSVIVLLWMRVSILFGMDERADPGFNYRKQINTWIFKEDCKYLTRHTVDVLLSISLCRDLQTQNIGRAYC